MQAFLQKDKSFKNVVFSPRGLIHRLILQIGRFNNNHVASPPQNPSVFEFFNKVANIISLEYDVGLVTATKIWTQISLWVDFIPITLDADSADNGGTKLFKDTKKACSPHSKEYIRGILQNLPNVKCIIVLGNEAWGFVQEMRKDHMISPDIKIFQHSPVMHPTHILKGGVTQREARWFYECIRDTINYLVDGPASKVVSKDTLQNNVRTVFVNCVKDDYKGNFIYRGIDNGKLLFIVRGYEEMKKLIRSYPGGSIPDEFPTFGEFVASDVNFEFRDLEIELVWFEDHDYSLEFGVHNERDMKAWVRKAKEMRGDEWTEKERQRKTWFEAGMGSVANKFKSSGRRG